MAQEKTTSNTLSVTSKIPAQLYAALISSSDDAIILKSLDGVILTWNQGAMRMYGYAPDEAIGQPMVMLCPPERVNIQVPGLGVAVGDHGYALAAGGVSPGS